MPTTAGGDYEKTYDADHQPHVAGHAALQSTGFGEVMNILRQWRAPDDAVHFFSRGRGDVQSADGGGAARGGRDDTVARIGGDGTPQ